MSPASDTSDYSSYPSEKSRGVAFALAALLGPFGAHRFYVGKTGTAALMLCTLGGLGVWYLYDLILVAGGSFRDIEGRLVSRWDPETPHTAQVSAEVLEELSALRFEVAELAERLDFTERLLANSSAAEGRPQSTPHI
ncbi:MAG TPA: NINE protein [Gemmatimonadales bacterium]|nr:NINE protein [Gemmatimonadales bacterium]